MTNDPYHDRKIVHIASRISPTGKVSPQCAKAPRPLNLARESWTLIPDLVTYKKCRGTLAKLACTRYDAARGSIIE
jgi:hypothetical protein